MAKQPETTEEQVEAPEAEKNGQAEKPAAAKPSRNGSAKPETKSKGKTPPAKTKHQPPKAKKRTTTKTADKRVGATKRLFPKDTLEEALRVPLAIKEKNGGQPFPPTDVATACGLSVKNVDFYYLLSSSQGYGLTTGLNKSPEILLTELGHDIAYPENAEENHRKKIEAFFSVPLFKSVFDYYKGGTLPEMTYLSSRLTKLEVPQKDHQAFADLFKKNYDYLSLSTKFEEIQREPSLAGGTVSVVGQKSGTYKFNAFVIMPFTEKGQSPRPAGFFKELLKSLLTPACNACDFGVSTADISGSDLIHHTIMKNLIEADLVIADLTDHNPNVAFELGVRIALDKPVAIIRAKATEQFFDVDNVMRVFDYDPCLWKSTIEQDIPKLKDHISATAENWGKWPSYMKLLTGDQQALSQAQAALGLKK
ncbi:MAG: nucleoside 2-deoxyribosyltransferase [Gemmataceae bacterium]